MCVKGNHGREISIELKTGMKCVVARSIKSAIEFVFAHVKDTGAAGLLEFERAEVQFFSIAWIPTYNVRLSVCGGG